MNYRLESHEIAKDKNRKGNKKNNAWRRGRKARESLRKRLKKIYENSVKLSSDMEWSHFRTIFIKKY